jgi:hypothetical protein
MIVARVVAAVATVALGAVILAGCAQEAQQETEEVVLATLPVEDTVALVDTVGVIFDPAMSSDGNGSFRVSSEEPTTFTVYQLGDLDIESVTLNYEAKVRCENVDGQVFIEMICVFPERGEYFSRALQSAVMGTSDWTQQSTPFFLQEGENPSNILLNIVVNGSGTAWIDDIRVTGGPLPEG